ncbi:hypothetical protein [Streptomyces tauricus]|uniref:hypothetical protein n=1 Tax=Streptomyces tauricus TaxID=68274 RepID=UPI002242E7BA|nr:hypothetical protein [Streptomyces tauricus]MCW8103545.1 hypothetical protein [Streptomyces tauricus]
MSRAEDPTPFPTGWPKARYRATRRAMKALRLADHLLRHGLAYTPDDATDEVIRTAALQSGHRQPSATTCSLVRAVLALLLFPAVSSSPTEDDIGGLVVRMVVTVDDLPTA